MDVNGVNYCSRTKLCSIEEMLAFEHEWNTLFINYAAVAWHEMRRAWRRDRSVASEKMPREPVTSWSTTTPDLHSSKQCLDGSVPLSKVVEVLVQVWEEDLKA